MSHLLFVLASVVSGDRHDFTLPAAEPCAALYVVTLRATVDDQVVIYDHWEDGLEPDGDDFFARLPTQASTLRFVLKAQQTISLFSHANGTAESCLPDALLSVGNGCGLQNQTCSPAASQPFCELHCAVAAAVSFRFDGNDRISTDADVQLLANLFPANAPPIALPVALSPTPSAPPLTVVLTGPASIDTASADSVEFDYHVSITNQIALALGSLVLNDPLPAGVTYVPGFDQGTTCTAGSTLSCTTPTTVQAPGQTTELSFRVKADTTGVASIDNQLEMQATNLLGILAVPSVLSNVASENVPTPPAGTDPSAPPTGTPPPAADQPPTDTSPPLDATGATATGPVLGPVSDGSTPAPAALSLPGNDTLGGGGCNSASNPSLLLFFFLLVPVWFRKSKNAS